MQSTGHKTTLLSTYQSALYQGQQACIYNLHFLFGAESWDNVTSHKMIHTPDTAEYFILCNSIFKISLNITKAKQILLNLS